MSEKRGIRIAKAIASVLIAIFLILFGVCAAGAVPISYDIVKISEDKAVVVADVFTHYNRNLSPPQARELARLVFQAGAKFQVEPFVLAAIIVRESSARPQVISKGGDYGLMQVRWCVHQKWIMKKYPQVRGAADLLKPEINIFVGAEIFSGYYAKRKTIRGALLRYSAGNKTLAKRVLSTFNELNKRYKEVKNERRIETVPVLRGDKYSGKGRTSRHTFLKVLRGNALQRLRRRNSLEENGLAGTRGLRCCRADR